MKKCTLQAQLGMGISSPPEPTPSLFIEIRFRTIRGGQRVKVCVLSELQISYLTIIRLGAGSWARTVFGGTPALENRRLGHCRDAVEVSFRSAQSAQSKVLSPRESVTSSTNTSVPIQAPRSMVPEFHPQAWVRWRQTLAPLIRTWNSTPLLREPSARPALQFRWSAGVRDNRRVQASI